jgi:NAD(P)H-dependent FMN reductase
MELQSADAGTVGRHEGHKDRVRVAIVLGTTRPGRKADAVAGWVLEHARQRSGVDFGLLDIADYGLPLLDEPLPAIHGQYEHRHTKAWARAVASFDAFIFVTPEYNRSIPGALKNAIDFLYAEWTNKAAAFVSYGLDAAGSRAVEHLRLVMAELEVADVRAHVALSLSEDFDEHGRVAHRPHQERKLEQLLDQLFIWTGALRTVRESAGAR